MAFTQEINGAAPATGAVAMWTVVSMLIAAGATKVADSDGTTYSSSGAQVTGGGSGTNGLGNTSAWVRLRLNGGREITIQRGSSNQQWRVKYSAQAQFSGGSPGATQTPQATDQAVRCGGGTDASPTYVALFATDASYKLYGCADAAGASFWYACVLNSGGTQSGGMLLDALGSVLASDTEPTALVVAMANASFTSATLLVTNADATTSGCMAWLKYGLAGATFAAMPMLAYGGWPNTAGQNPHTTKEMLRYVEYERISSLASPTGYKGISSCAAWNASSRSAKELYLVGSAYRICFGDLNLPFVSSVVL